MPKTYLGPCCAQLKLAGSRCSLADAALTVTAASWLMLQVSRLSCSKTKTSRHSAADAARSDRLAQARTNLPTVVPPAL